MRSGLVLSQWSQFAVVSCLQSQRQFVDMSGTTSLEGFYVNFEYTLGGLRDLCTGNNSQSQRMLIRRCFVQE